jgi:hypothetical protein
MGSLMLSHKYDLFIMHKTRIIVKKEINLFNKASKCKEYIVISSIAKKIFNQHLFKEILFIFEINKIRFLRFYTD